MMRLSAAPQALNNFRAGAWLPLMEEAGLMVTEKIDGERLRLPMYSPYALRHYFASKLIEKGKDLKFIQNAMGHSKIEITLNVLGICSRVATRRTKGRRKSWQRRFSGSVIPRQRRYELDDRQAVRRQKMAHTQLKANEAALSSCGVYVASAI